MYCSQGTGNSSALPVNRKPKMFAQVVFALSYENVGCFVGFLNDPHKDRVGTHLLLSKHIYFHSPGAVARVEEHHQLNNGALCMTDYP